MAGSPTKGHVVASRSGLSRRPLWFVRIALVITLFAGVTLGVRAMVMKDVQIHVSGEKPIVVTTAALRVSTALSRAGVQLFEGDVVAPSLDAPLRRGEVITVKRAFPVKIIVDGKLLEIRTVGGSVQSLLDAAGVKLSPDDKTNLNRYRRIEAATTISVVRVTYGFTTVTDSIPFQTKRRSDPSMDRGKTRVVRDGAVGTIRYNVRLTYEDGKLANRKVTGSEVVQKAVDEIIAVGSRLPRIVFTSSGRYLQYKEVKTMLATAYTPGDGVTSTGVRAKRGVAAVDPTVIPLGTRLFIPGYGEAVAADVGGAIKGMRIDLLYESYHDAIHFGRRAVKVYILARR